MLRAIRGHHGKDRIFKSACTAFEDAFQILHFGGILVGCGTDTDKRTGRVYDRFLRQETLVCILLARSPDAGDAVALRDCGHEQDRAIGALGLGESGLERAEPDNATIRVITNGFPRASRRLNFHGLIMPRTHEGVMKEELAP